MIIISKDIKQFVKEFVNTNGNKTFTNKELIIYFNKKHEKRMDEILEMINQLRQDLTGLPCHEHNERLVKVETTNKVTTAIVGISLTIIGVVAAYFKLS